jgi:hypothetical protein
MKKILMVLAVITALSSCEQNGKETTKETKKTDSMTNQPSSSLDSTLIPMASADTLIYNYNQYLKNIQHDTLSYSSFMLNAQALREYLMSNPNIVTLNVYLAKNERGKMTDTSMNLVYIGAVDSLGANDTVYNVEKPYYKLNDPHTPYFLNHSFPCPTCVDRIEAYTPPEQHNH